MQPTLFDVSFFGHALALDARGLCLTVAIVAALTVSLLLARREGIAVAGLRDLGLELILVGVLGARLLHLAWHAAPYAAACGAAVTAGEGAFSACTGPLWMWEGGMAFYGGLGLALAWLLWRGPRRGVDPLRTADRATPGLALAYAITSIGCFLAGCCYGRPTGSRFGLRFPPESIAFQQLADRGQLPPWAALTPPLHPVQLEAAVAHLLGFAILCWIMVRRRPAPGRLFLFFLVGHALIRLALRPLSDPLG